MVCILTLGQPLYHLLIRKEMECSLLQNCEQFLGFHQRLLLLLLLFRLILHRFPLIQERSFYKAHTMVPRNLIIQYLRLFQLRSFGQLRLQLPFCFLLQVYSTKSISLSYIRGEYYVSLCIVTKKCTFILYKKSMVYAKKREAGDLSFFYI
ncbi:hypothetical protein EMIT040CA3_20359 [Bacillus pseudomycoides]